MHTRDGGPQSLSLALSAAVPPRDFAGVRVSGRLKGRGPGSVRSSVGTNAIQTFHYLLSSVTAGQGAMQANNGRIPALFDRWCGALPDHNPRRVVIGSLAAADTRGEISGSSSGDSSR